MKSDLIVKVLAWVAMTVFGVLLAITGFFSAQTYSTIKNLEKEVFGIRLKLTELEAKRIDREEIRRLIAEYHDSHPNYRKDDR